MVNVSFFLLDFIYIRSCSSGGQAGCPAIGGTLVGVIGIGALQKSTIGDCPLTIAYMQEGCTSKFLFLLLALCLTQNHKCQPHHGAGE